MPRSEESVPQPSPRVDPLSYPGSTLPYSYLWLDTWIYRLSPSRYRRVGQWGIDLDGGPLTERSSYSLVARHVNQALLLANAAPMDTRHPILSIGSNAAPAQLFDKFGSSNQVSRVIPVTRASVSRLALSHSPHVSTPGYVPYTVVDSGAKNDVLDVAVLWLDSYQLATMSETEPNYELVTLAGQDHLLTLESEERLPAFGAYRGRWGALRWSESEGPAAVRDQRDLWAGLVARSWFAHLVGTADPTVIAERMRDDPDARDAVRDELARRSLTVTDGLLPQSGRLPVYGDLMPVVPATERRLLVSSTPDTRLRRRGEQYVVLPAEGAPRDRAARHVVVSRHHDPRSPRVLARVEYSSALRRPDIVGLDQTIRNGLGIEIGESAELQPVKLAPRWAADLILSPPQYVLCRVQVAGLLTVEQQVCTIAPLVLEMLGTSPGDEVVIEGVPRSGRVDVPTLRMKAYATPAEVTEERVRLSGGDLNSRFPSAQDAFGVHPDLPWVFLDSATRSTLGVDDVKLSVVRVRASRSYQLGKELREGLLLLVLAFVGLITVLTSTWAIVATTGLLVVLVLLMIHRRLRRRLSRRFVSNQRGT